MRAVSLCVLLAALGCTSSTPKRRSHLATATTFYWTYDTRNGVPDGNSKTFYPSGAMKSEGYFLDGYRHGLHRAFDEEGTVVEQAMFWYDTLVWSSSSKDDAPPKQLLLELVAYTSPEQTWARFGPPYSRVQEQGFVGVALGPPAISFVNLDRTLDEGRRVGIGFGLGGNPASISSVQRYTVSGSWPQGRHSGFFRLGGSSAKDLSGDMSGSISGRQTLELGGTSGIWDGLGKLRARFSISLAVGNDDREGFIAAAASTRQQPAEVATSVPESIALRNSLSWGLGGRYWVAQVDTGVDLAMGAPDGRVPAFGRLGLGVGFGLRSAVLSLESNSAVELTSVDRNSHSLGVGLSVHAFDASLKSLVARNLDGVSTLFFGSEYAF